MKIFETEKKVLLPIKNRLWIVLMNIIDALLITIILEEGIREFAQILFLISINIFAFPLFLAWRWVWWVQYIIIIGWISNLYYVYLVEEGIKKRSNNDD